MEDTKDVILVERDEVKIPYKIYVDPEIVSKCRITIEKLKNMGMNIS